MLSALVIAAALAAGQAAATSSGRFIFDCNARSDKLGCDQNDYANYPGDRFPQEFGATTPPSRNGYCNSRAGGPTGGSQEMHWTFLAERSDNYRVVVSKVNQGEANPITSYQPGELLDIHVRVMQGGRQATAGFDFHDAPFARRPTTADYWATAFRGIMLHWEKSADNNAAGNFVDGANFTNINVDPRPAPDGDYGYWEVSEQTPPLFHTPAGSCGDSNQVLLHATGGYKQTYNKFQFRAPRAGTGTMALRVLVKSGDANWGWFWWPNAAGDVVLTEGSPYQPRANTRWVRGALGESCSDACARYDPSYICVENTLSTIDDEAKLRDVVQDGAMNCVEPIWSGCSNLGPTTSTNGACFFASPTCAAEGRNTAAPTCAATSTDTANGRRLCPCGPQGTTGVVPTGRTTTGNVLAPASSGSSGSPNCDREGEVIRAGACVCDEEAGYTRGTDGLCTEGVNSASTAAPSVAVAAVAAVAALGSSSRMTLVIALALALAVVAAPANAHNWLRSKSRAAFASTAAPFPPRTSDSPHVMVAFDQKFQVEWVVGHSRETYWLITHSSHLGMLQTVRDADLDQYIADRPSSQQNLHLDVSWRRWHRRRGTFTQDMTTYPSASAYRPETTNDWRNSDGTYDFRDFFESNTLDTAGPLPGQAADDRIPRSGAFSPSGAVSTGRGGVDTGNYYRQEYKDADLSLDARAKYTNPTWPWILEIVRCEHNANQASQPDVVNIAITLDASDPTRTPGPGHYMANWRWRGYYDMVDVDVRSGADVPIADVYGSAYTGGAPYRRMDHALFANTRQVWPSTMRDDTRCTAYHGSVEAAIRRCNRVGSTGVLACDGVNIWPLYVPSGVNSNLNTNGANGFNPMIPWNTNASYGCFQDDFNGAPAGTMVMAAVAARQSIDDRQPGIATTEDPEDLVFHSAIFAKDTGRNFTHVLQPGSPFLTSEPDLEWRYSHKCTQNCADLTAYEGFTVPPLGAKDEGCRNCEREPETPAVVYDGTPDSTEYFLNSRCGSDTLPGNNMIDPVAPADYKLLAPRGSHREMLSSNTACAEMTKADPDCSEFYVRREGEDSEGGRVCFCLRNSAAPCDRVNDGSHTVFQINSAATAADPTCARGTLSTSRDRCCPASCSQADCDAGNGVCYTSNTNTLECTVRGAPCFFTNPLPAAPASNSTA